jgi:crossover junction endodeoxyribonuclease RuvC
MRILGIDPGTLVVGYGVIDSQSDEMKLVCCDALSCSRKLSLGERLSYLYDKLTEVISTYQPDVVAIEQPFVSRNVRTALAIGKAQAVAILAASQRGIPVHEYSPARIKRVVADYGASTKEQVQKMVGLQLGMAQPPQPDDAADALAVAICHLREVHLKGMVAEQGETK